MIADRCEINRQIRADNKMLRELKAKVVKLAEAVEKSIPIIAETLEAIRNHMIFTLCHLLHNEMQKEVIHDWMNHFNPILNKYNTVKKELKAKVTERKELNVQKDKTSILNPHPAYKIKSAAYHYYRRNRRTEIKESGILSLRTQKGSRPAKFHCLKSLSANYMC